MKTKRRSYEVATTVDGSERGLGVYTSSRGRLLQPGDRVNLPADGAGHGSVWRVLEVRHPADADTPPIIVVVEQRTGS
jgi:cation transport regulator ChaC